MSLQSITEKYKNSYRLKGDKPAWLTLLTKSVNSRNISTVDWNIAMDDIRKVACDSLSVYNFINAFNDEFNDYYNRAIKSIRYDTNTESKLKLSSNNASLSKTPSNLTLKSMSDYFNIDTLDTLKDDEGEHVFFEVGGNYEPPVGFIIELNELTYIDCVQVYFNHVVDTTELIVETSDGTGYVEKDAIILNQFSHDVPDTRMFYINDDVKFIRITQQAGWTNGRFGIKGIEFFKDTHTGKYVLTRYDGVSLDIPLIDPVDFNDHINEHVVSAKKYADQSKADSIDAAISSASSKKFSDTAESWATGAKNGVEVSASDPTYHNNAKHYKDIAEIVLSDVQAVETSIDKKYADAQTYFNNLKTDTAKEVKDLLAAADVEFDEDSTTKVSGLLADARLSVEQMVTTASNTINAQITHNANLAADYANAADVSKISAAKSEAACLDYQNNTEQYMYNAANSASDADTTLKELQANVADSMSSTNSANKLLRLDSTGKIPSQYIPIEKTIEMFEIHNEEDLTTLSNAGVGDIAYMLNSDGTSTVANYRLVGNDYSNRSNWILQTVNYVSQAAVADRATEADNTTKVNGVLIRFGSIEEYGTVDHEGLYIITDYSESGT